MGFEIAYQAYKKKEEGVGYDVENPFTFSKKLGKMEEVTIEKLAQSILLQLARRDIMIFKVEIFEYVKKEVPFREIKGGIAIKNKKFKLDGSLELEPEEAKEEVQEAPREEPRTEIKSEARVPVRYEIFSGDSVFAGILTRKNVWLTPDKRYPVFQEKAANQSVKEEDGSIRTLPGYSYLIQDDRDRYVWINGTYFNPITPGLSNQPREIQRDNNVQLDIPNRYDSSMPVLRRNY